MVRPIFESFLQAGFECSCHKNRLGNRLNLLESTQHHKFAELDFQRLKSFGFKTARSAVSWPFAEPSPGIFDFKATARLLDAAQQSKIELLLDILHFGWPDHVDVFSEGFPDRFAAFTYAVAELLKNRGVERPMLAPVNEISYLSWAGGDKALISPHEINRGIEFKRNLIRAAVAASQVLLTEFSGIRLIAPEPVIHIVGNPDVPGDIEEASGYTATQFEAWDMLSGRLAPELGGRPEYLDIIGVNFYDRNEWSHNSNFIPRTDPRYRHFHKLLEDVWHRYRRPMFVSETGTEGEDRQSWFTYICNEVALAQERGIPIHGICLYPIVNHPGWDDDRHCNNGLFDYADVEGNRKVYQPLADAIETARLRFSRNHEDNTDDNGVQRSDLLFSSPMGICFPATSTSDEPLRSNPQSFLL